MADNTFPPASLFFLSSFCQHYLIELILDTVTHWYYPKVVIYYSWHWLLFGCGGKGRNATESPIGRTTYDKEGYISMRLRMKARDSAGFFHSSEFTEIYI